MLNGIDPVMIFLFYKKVAADGGAIPTNAPLIDKLALPPIPIYLSEKLTGIYIDAEDKNIDIETTMDSLGSGGTPNTSQKALHAGVKIEMLANKGSIGLSILSALADQILPKVTSQEYSLTYLHGATTIFDGLLHSFNVHQEANTTLMKVTMEIINAAKKTAQVSVEKDPNVLQLNNTGSVPAGGPSGPPGGGPVPPTPSSLPLGPTG